VEFAGAFYRVIWRQVILRGDADGGIIWTFWSSIANDTGLRKILLLIRNI
jgi:hypothetical protein